MVDGDGPVYLLGVSHLDGHRADPAPGQSRSQGDQYPGIFPGNKTRLEMLVPIQPELHDILTEVLGQPQVAMDMPLVGAHFLTYTTSNLTNGFKDYVRRVGIDPGSRGPHALRHSFCSLMTQIGVSPFAVMGMVGHVTAQVHLNYTQSAAQYACEVHDWPRRPRFYLRTNTSATENALAS